MQTQERAAAGAPDTGFAGDSQLDQLDVLRGLAHMEVLRERVDHHRARRLRDFPSLARTSAAAHLREHGHALAFGCCVPYVDQAAKAA